MRNGFGRLLLLAALLPVLAGCGGGSGNAGPPSGSSKDPLHPNIVPNPKPPPDAWYEPNPLRVKVGKVITWTNEDTDPHDVTAYDGSFASGPIGAHGQWRWIFSKPGTYTFFCTLHPEMHGTLIVTR